MQLTLNQIESFYLICLKKMSSDRESYLDSIKRLGANKENEEQFYLLSRMINLVLSYYKSKGINSCLSYSQLFKIMTYLNRDLCLDVCLSELPETNLNSHLQCS